jgi:hypothetical protein
MEDQLRRFTEIINSEMMAGPQARHGRSRGAADPARPRHALHPGADAARSARAAGPPQEP